MKLNRQNYENLHGSLRQTLTKIQFRSFCIWYVGTFFSFKWNTGPTDFIILLKLISCQSNSSLFSPSQVELIGEVRWSTVRLNWSADLNSFFTCARENAWFWTPLSNPVLYDSFVKYSCVIDRLVACIVRVKPLLCTFFEKKSICLCSCIFS